MRNSCRPKTEAMSAISVSKLLPQKCSACRPRPCHSTASDRGKVGRFFDSCVPLFSTKGAIGASPRRGKMPWNCKVSMQQPSVERNSLRFALKVPKSNRVYAVSQGHCRAILAMLHEQMPYTPGTHPGRVEVGGHPELGLPIATLLTWPGGFLGLLHCCQGLSFVGDHDLFAWLKTANDSRQIGLSFLHGYRSHGLLPGIGH